MACPEQEAPTMTKAITNPSGTIAHHAPG